MKIVAALIILVIIVAVIASAVKARKNRAKAKRVVADLGTTTYRSSVAPKAEPTRRIQPRYDYSGTVYNKPSPKPVKRREDSTYGYVEPGDSAFDGYVSDTSWYSEPTTNYQAPDTSKSDYGSSYSSSSDYSSGSSSSSYGSSSSSSSDSGSSSSSSDSGSY